MSSPNPIQELEGMANPTPGTREWLDQVVEEIIEPERPLVDPHHHLWQRPGFSYLLEHLWEDTGSGHNIEKTVFVECRASYLESGPEHLRPTGETVFVAEIAEQSARSSEQAEIAGIVAHADLTLSDGVEEVLAEHDRVGKGLFRGIRHAGARAEHPDALTIAGRAPEGLYTDADFRTGMAVLGRLGLTYDTWHYHYQNASFAELARAVPETIMILDHFGTPLGVGPYAERRAEIFEKWKADIVDIASCPNVVAKLGGLAMPDNGFGWDRRDRPAGSDEFVEAQRPYYLHAIDCFGPERCMFESNFPVDKRSMSYRVLWNGLKKLAADFSEDEKDAMFRGTAMRIYRLR
jgi:predicted TIM-barrel fold metal-dependent hydrolase